MTADLARAERDRLVAALAEIRVAAEQARRAAGPRSREAQLARTILAILDRDAPPPWQLRRQPERPDADVWEVVSAGQVVGTVWPRRTGTLLSSKVEYWHLQLADDRARLDVPPAACRTRDAAAHLLVAAWMERKAGQKP